MALIDLENAHKTVHVPCHSLTRNTSWNKALSFVSITFVIKMTPPNNYNPNNNHIIQINCHVFSFILIVSKTIPVDYIVASSQRFSNLLKDDLFGNMLAQIHNPNEHLRFRQYLYTFFLFVSFIIIFLMLYEQMAIIFRVDLIRNNDCLYAFCN